MSKFKVAAQLFTLREFLKTEEAIEDTFKKVKAMGYNAIQVSGVGVVDFNFIKKAADKEELAICATHIPFNRLLSDFDGVVKQHKLWECKYVGIGSMPDSYRQNKEGYIDFARTASTLGKKLLEEDLQLIYHNHDFEFRKFHNISGMDILMNNSDMNTLNFEIDTYWVQSGGGSPEAWVRKVKDRMRVVHFKDMCIDDNGKQIMTEVGEGNLDWTQIIKACDDIGVQWAAVEQDVCIGSPFDALEKSLQNLKKLGCNF
jgi:sugar phosphate isomerase/epimerase